MAEKKFYAYLTATVSFTATVWAEDEDEASEKAWNLSPYDPNVDEPEFGKLLAVEVEEA